MGEKDDESNSSRPIGNVYFGFAVPGTRGPDDRQYRGQNYLYSGCTILAVPSFRDRIPVIVDQVTTLVGPGELIDVVVTERGVAVNPRRTDLLDVLSRNGSKLSLRSLDEIRVEVERLCGGKPALPRLGDQPVAVIRWVDGTPLDTAWQVL